MPNYNPNAKSLVYGLSDFWTLYFRELPLIEEIYRGVEIDIGQVYLDLLSLLLTSSVQDTSVFNKQYFQLVRLREDGITYASDGLYGSALATNMASLKYLNNRVFGVTEALERDVDFTFDAASRSALFEFDPLSAYRGTTFGTGNASLTITTRVTDPLASQLRFALSNTVTHPPTVVRAGYDITVSYSLGVTTANDIVALLNTHAETRELFVASLPGATLGTGSPPVAALAPLKRLATAPLQGFATRTFDVLFGTKFQDLNVPSWLDLDVQKGDVLRVISAPDYGPPQEFPIALVKEDRLILYPQIAPADIPSGIHYTILRSPANDQVENEPFLNPSPAGFVFDVTTTITGATRTLEFGAPFAPFPSVIIGSTVILSSPVNAGQYTIREVIASPYSWVVDGNPLVDEVNATTVLYTQLTQLNTDGVLGATVNGRANFSSAAAAFTATAIGGVLSLDLLGNGVVTKYPVVDWIDANNITIEIGAQAGSAGLLWAIADLARYTNTLMYAAPLGWLVPGTVVVNARRWLDNAAVVEGRDYIVNVDTGSVQTLTVWEPSETNRVDYRYRLSQHNTVDYIFGGGGDGLLTAGPTPTFFMSAYTFTAANIGNRLRVSGAANPANNGDYLITGILGPNTVSLSPNHTPVLPDGNNGLLFGFIYSRGNAVVTDVIEPVLELGMWAPDALIDKYHLYFSYGYLIDRIQHSSEAYRALIRGLFQLFMLGPTLERFESAINVAAGLSVIRDDGEIFLDYESGALRMGSDGVFDAFTQTFTSPTAAFVPEDLSNHVYAKTGFNANKLFRIAAVVNNTTVLLVETPTTDTGISWEITATSEHAIVTSRARYSYPRSAPLKAKFLNPANEGVLVLRAFEVVTAAFTITDYVETPFWWESARIPQVLLPDYSTPQRRQSTPALFENIINPGDGGCVGDPGYFVGADDEGSVIPTTVLRSGPGGVLYGDPLYPSSTSETFFEGGLVNFTADDVGNYVRVSGIAYRITAIVSTNRAKIVSYIPHPFTGTSPSGWEIIAGTIPLRHTAAYMVLDRVLKYHLFTVQFDGFLLEQLPANVIRDLQELVFIAKPTYTYLLLTPGLLFEEVIRMVESPIEVDSTLNPGGQEGEIVLGNTNPLVVGPDWIVGSWYRYVDNTSSFVAPLATLSNSLGVPGAGYRRRPSKIYVEPADFTRSGVPVGYDEPVFATVPPAGVAGAVSIVSGEVVFSVDPIYGVPEANALLNYIRILAPSPNAGLYRIGRIVGLHDVVLDATGLVPETGVAWEFVATGSQVGNTSFTSEGESFFTDATGNNVFTPGSVGTYIRRIYNVSPGADAFRIAEYISAEQVRIAEEKKMVPAGTTLTANVLTSDTVEVPSMVFNASMTYLDRYAVDPTTARRREYFLSFSAGSNAGAVVRLLEYISPTVVRVSGTLNVEVGGLLVPYYREHYTGTPESGSWENYQHVMWVDNEAVTPDQMTLPTTGVDAGVVTYTAYGVQEPVVPIVAVFDAAAGDTYYTVGGVLPVPRFMRSRTALDADLIEMPVQIYTKATSIDLTTALTFSRSSVATYLTSAPTTGSPGFVSQAANDVLRVQNRGVRPAIFLEGERTNLVTQSRNIADASFAAGVSVTTTADVGNGVTGTAVADRSQVTVAGGYTRNFNVGFVAGDYSASVWTRSDTGVSPFRTALLSAIGPGTVGFLESTTTTTWSERRVRYTSPGATVFFIPSDGRDYTAAGGSGVQTPDIWTDFIQVEAAAFSSSSIETTGATGTRTYDQARILAANVPVSFRTVGIKATFAPECTSAELIAHTADMTLFAFGTGVQNRISLVVSGGTVRVRVVVSGITQVLTSAITFSRWQDITITADALAGSVTVAGAAAGNGTYAGVPWVMPAGDLYVGNVSTLSFPYFGEILPVVTIP